MEDQDAAALLAGMMGAPPAPAAPVEPAAAPPRPRAKRQGGRPPAEMALPPPKRPRAAEPRAPPPPAAVVQRRAARQPTSRYVGVCWDKKKRRWRAEIYAEGRSHALGGFADEEKAARAFDKAARRLRGAEAHGGGRNGRVQRLNFPTKKEAAAGAARVDHIAPADEAALAAAEATVAQRKAAGQTSSRYAGVDWQRDKRRWRAQIRHEGRNQELGCWETEEEAARKFDNAARRMRGDGAHGGKASNGTPWRLNFPTQAEVAAAPDVEGEPVDEGAVSAAEAAVAQRRAAGQPASRYVGVAWAKEERRWRVGIQIKGRTQGLGFFVEEETAARAFDESARELRGDAAHGGGYRGRWRLNFPTQAESDSLASISAGVGAHAELLRRR